MCIRDSDALGQIVVFRVLIIVVVAVDEHDDVCLLYTSPERLPPRGKLSAKQTDEGVGLG